MGSIRGAISALALLATGVAGAQTHLMNELDFIKLPPECSARLRGDKATMNMWRQRIGDRQFLHLHHYCFGLFYLNRGMATVDKRKRNRDFEHSVGEFQYVIDRWPATSPYRQQALQAQQRARMLTMH